MKILYNEKKRWAKLLAKKIEKYIREKEIGGNITIVVGGDGTIFFHKHQLEGVVVGIGSEKSCLCFPRSKWREAIESFIKEPRWKECISLSVNNRIAINDVVVRTKYPILQRFVVEMDGEKYITEGDGVLIFTPIGSTAYAFSVGAPFVERDMKAIGIYSISPFRGKVEKIVKPKPIKVLSDRSFYVSIDGQEIFEAKEITVKPGKKFRFFLKEML